MVAGASYSKPARLAQTGTGQGERLVQIGHISGVFGVQGWVKVHSDTRPRRNILDYRTWLLYRNGTWEQYTLRSGRVQGKGLIAHIEGCNDREAAAALIGTPIAIAHDQLPALEAGDYYWTDLYGLRVVTVDGTDLGVVDHMLETGSNDVLVVRGDKQRLIPFLTGSVVTEVDLDQGRLTVDWDPDF